MSRFTKLLTVALAAIALGVGSLGAATAYAKGGGKGGGHGMHGHHGHHHWNKHRGFEIVISGDDDDDCEWKWVRTRSGYLVKKWVCD